MHIISRVIVVVSLLNLYQCVGVAHNMESTNDAPSTDHVVGGANEQDANNPKYLKLAEESMAKYLLEAKVDEEHLIKKVEKVTTQVVAGTLTHIYYVIEPKNCDGSCKKAKKCHSKIWEKPWENFKEITTVSCEEVAPKSKRQVPGGESDADVNDPKYKALAEESLSKYKESSGSKSSLTITKISKVTTQVVAGTLTKIEFEIAAGSEQYVCKSEIHEQPWLNKKDITVTCTPKSG